MYNVQLGSLVLNFEIIIYLVAGIAGIGALWWRQKQGLTHPLTANVATNALLIWILVWKLSLFIVDFSLAWATPSSILYYSGGPTGVMLATLVAATYLWLTLSNHNKNTFESFVNIILFIAVSVTVYFVGDVLFRSAIRPIDWIIVVASLSVALFIAYPRSIKSWTSMTTLFLMYVILIAAVIVFAKQSNATSPTIDEKPVQFTLQNVQGEQVQLADYTGKIVIVNFWATWCPPCRAEMPHMQQLFAGEVEKRQDVALLAVNVTSTEKNASVVNDFVQTHHLTLPVLLDTTGDVSRAFRIRSFPTTVFIDRQGKIVYRQVGAIDQRTIRTILKNIH